MNVLRNGATVIYAQFVSAFSEPQTELQFGTHKSTAPPTAVFLCLFSLPLRVTFRGQKKVPAHRQSVEAFFT